MFPQNQLICWKHFFNNKRINVLMVQKYFNDALAQAA
jgi:hypothetical protein